MPFRSQAQRRKLWAINPELARRFEAETPKGAHLPDHVAKKKPRKHTGYHPRKR